MTQNNLAIALSNQADAADAALRAPLLADAVQCYRNALEVYTRHDFPSQHDATKESFVEAVRQLAELSLPGERERLLAEAAAFGG